MGFLLVWRWEQKRLLTLAPPGLQGEEGCTRPVREQIKIKPRELNFWQEWSECCKTPLRDRQLSLDCLKSPIVRLSRSRLSNVEVRQTCPKISVTTSTSLQSWPFLRRFCSRKSGYFWALHKHLCVCGHILALSSEHEKS